jgi:hypothetical protein
MGSITPSQDGLELSWRAGWLATATLSGSSRSLEVSRVCPQGSVLPPLLFCLVVELIARLIGGGVFIQGYADICLLAAGKSANTVSGVIHWTLHTVEMLCDEVGLLVNLDKTGHVVFTRRRKLLGLFEPRFLG